MGGRGKCAGGERDEGEVMTRTAIYLSLEQVDIARLYALDMEIGGQSNIRADSEARQRLLREDQFTSALGELALSVYITGSHDAYVETRNARNQDKYTGDNGSDLLGHNIDMKTSRMRRGIHFMYNLWVRPREYKEETIYYLGLVPENRDDIVYLAGWAYGTQLRQGQDKYGGVRYELCETELTPCEIREENEWKLILT